MDSKVSLFIPVKNGLPYIIECIDSIVSQSFTDWKLFIVDNCSTDGTIETIKSRYNDTRISLVVNEADIGAIGNFNKCLQLCESKYYAILSHDDKYSCRDAISNSVEILDSNRKVNAIYSHVNWIDEKSRNIYTRKLPYSNTIETARLAKESILTCRNLFGVPLLVRSLAGKAYSYSSDLYHTGDVDHSIKTGINDTVFRIDKVCYSIRFHKSNNTMRNTSSNLVEFLKIADSNNIALTKRQTNMMKINCLILRIKKSLFFKYIDYLR